MDIIFYLITFLKTRKKVGIAGLGTFYKIKSPGKYDAAQHAFLPPTYTLAFKTELEAEDELADYISSERKITPESANYYISEFAEQVQAKLADQHEADLGELGKFELHHDELNFIPSPNLNIGNEFYGLPTLPEIESNGSESNAWPIIEEEKLEEIVEENKLEEENPGQETPIEEEFIAVPDDQPVYEEITDVATPINREESYDNSAPVIHSEEEVREEEEEPYEEEPKKSTSFFVKFLIVLLLIAVAGAIAYFINPQFFDQYIQKKESLSVPPLPIKLPPDSVKYKNDSNQVDSLATGTPSTTQVVPNQIDTTKKYYEVIGTSENSLAAADKYIARVAKIGITAKHIKLSKTRYSVSLGTFADSKEAMAYQDSLRIVLKNKGIYTWTVKPKKHTK